MAKIPRREVYVKRLPVLCWQVIDHKSGHELEFVQGDHEYAALAERLGFRIDLQAPLSRQIEVALELLYDNEFELRTPYDIWGEYPEVFELDPEMLEQGRFYG